MVMGIGIMPNLEPRRKDAPKKSDTGKLEWHLLNYRAMECLVRVMMGGKIKYGEENWKGFESDPTRVKDAIQRHLAAIMEGEMIDDESGEPHAAHIMAGGMFLTYFELCKKSTHEYINKKGVDIA